MATRVEKTGVPAESRASRLVRPAKDFGLVLGGLILLQAVFFLLLIAGQAVPDKPIVDNLATSVQAGTYGPSGIPDRMGGIADTFTECVVVGTGLGSEGESALARAVSMPRISNCSKGAEEILSLEAGKEVASGVYYKYWAGYTVITRPALALVGLDGLRILSGAMLAGSTLLVFGAVSRHISRWAAVALLAPLLLATNLMSTPSTSFSQAIAISFIFLGTALTVWGASRNRLWLMGSAALGAALFCYVDLLTTPAIPWALASAVAAGVVYSSSRNLRKGATAGVLAAVVWPISFAITWVARWVIAAAFLGWNEVMEFVRSNVEFRSSGDYRGVEHSLGAATMTNIKYWWDHVPTAAIVFFVAVLAAGLALLIAWRRSGISAVLSALVLALPAVIVPVWYEALSNHSQLHDFFVYRGIPTAIAVCVFAAVVAASPRRRDDHLEGELRERTKTR